MSGRVRQAVPLRSTGNQAEARSQSLRARIILLTLVACGLAPSFSPAQQVGLGNQLDVLVNQQIDSLIATYKHLHANPELSGREEKTSAFVAHELQSLGYTVTERVGKYSRPEWVG